MKEVEEKKKRDALIRANFAKHRAAVSRYDNSAATSSMIILRIFSGTVMEADR